MMVDHGIVWFCSSLDSKRLLYPEGIEAISLGSRSASGGNHTTWTFPGSRADILFRVTNPEVFAALDRRLIAEIPSG
jgi:hypothetical protein